MEILCILESIKLEEWVCSCAFQGACMIKIIYLLKKKKKRKKKRDVPNYNPVHMLVRDCSQSISPILR